MSTSLDPVWASHQQASGALKIVRRVMADPAVSSEVPAFVKDTQFEALSPAEIDPTINELQEHIDDQTVISLFTAFEAELIDHVVNQEVLIRQHAASVSSAFADSIAEFYKSICRQKMNVSVALRLFDHLPEFQPADDVRVYRNWLAHGKKKAMPTQATPLAAYKALGDFLAAI
ncbi:MAG: hypothetical protein NTV94_11610 [Planctomycetota bacterium]|nr:hypothetical protein [Planctomycetota bacterium]